MKQAKIVIKNADHQTNRLSIRGGKKVREKKFGVASTGLILISLLSKWI
jgi:hypothetical protein